MVNQNAIKQALHFKKVYCYNCVKWLIADCEPKDGTLSCDEYIDAQSFLIRYRDSIKELLSSGMQYHF